MTQIIRSLRGLWRTERLLLSIMVLCIFFSALLMPFSYGLWQNYHVTLQESSEELKELKLSTASEQELPVGTFRDYIRAIPAEITSDMTLCYTGARFGCLADHIERTDAEWEEIRQKYAYYDEIPDSIWETLDALHLEGEEYQAKYAELAEPYRQKDTHLKCKDTYYEDEDVWTGYINFRFTFQNGDFAPCPLYEANLEKNGNMHDGDRFFTKEEYAEGAKVIYFEINDELEYESLKISDNVISLFGEPYTIICNGMGNPEPPITAVPADTMIPEKSQVAFLFEHNLTKKSYDAMKNLAEEMMPGVLVFPELPFPDNDSMYLSRNIMLISALIAVLSVLNFVMLYHFILQRRSRSLAIFRMTGCTAFKAVRMYLGECFVLGIPVYLLGLGLFLLLLKYAFSGIFPYMAGAFSPDVYAAIFGMYLLAMLVMLSVMVTHHVRQNILSEFYGREDA